MNVVQVNCVFDKGVADPDALLERYTTLVGWSEALLAAGAEGVAVVQRFHRDATLKRRGVEYVFVSDRRSPALRPWDVSSRQAAAVARLSPKVVHVNGLHFPLQVRRLHATIPREAALVLQNHSGGGGVGRAPVLRLLARAARTPVDGFLFAAEEHAAVWRRSGVVGPLEPAYIVMPASSTFQPLPREGAREASGVRGAPAILWVGRLTANKDPITVLDGFERSLASLPDATLTMIFGTDELLPAVQGRIGASPALRDRVRLAGAIRHQQMPAFFSAADLFIVGSHAEGSGYALMEACACGTVPVVPRIPTFTALTCGGELGPSWTPGDAVDCARALTEAASRDPDAGRQSVIAYFARALSWPAIGRRALDIYSEVLAKKR